MSSNLSDDEFRAFIRRNPDYQGEPILSADESEEISRIAAAMNGRIQPSEVQLGHDLMIPAARLYAAGIRVVQPAPERVHPKGCLGHDRAGNCVDRNAEVIP